MKLWNDWSCEPILPSMWISICYATPVQRKRPNKALSSQAVSKSSNMTSTELIWTFLTALKRHHAKFAFIVWRSHVVCLGRCTVAIVRCLMNYCCMRRVYIIFWNLDLRPFVCKERWELSLCIALRWVVGLHLQFNLI